jgi:hypothetical protein
VLTPEQENKIHQLQHMLEIASLESVQTVNGVNVGLTIVTNLGTMVNPAFLAAGLTKSAAVLATKFKKEFETKLLSLAIKQMPVDAIDAMLKSWEESTPDFARMAAEIKVQHNKAVGTKAKLKGGLSAAKQLGKDDWKDLVIEGLEVGEHLAEHLPHLIETLAHGLPGLGIVASIWGVIANVRKVRHLREELAVLEEKRFDAQGQPAAPAP